MDQEATDIFISYASEDRREAAGLAGFLTDRGYKVWWDRELVAGQDFHATIERMLKECKVRIVIWTEISIKSRWVLGEAETAANAHKPVPVRIDTLPPSPLPVGFVSLHTVALGDRADLIGAIQAHLAAPAKAVSRREVALARTGRALRLLRRRLTLGRVVAAAIALAILGYLGLDTLEWLNIRESVNADDFSGHLRRFPISPFASSARAKLAGTSEWPSIRDTRNPSDLETYLKKYPDSIYSGFARLRLTRLQALSAGSYRPLIPDSHARALEATDLAAMSCNDLWTARNEIFYALGYCFVSQDAITKFRTSQDCPYHACRIVQTYNGWVTDQVVSQVERSNIETIRTVEQQKGCRLSLVTGPCGR
jgi:hypothetical protein